jgi:hypothetical protein
MSPFVIGDKSLLPFVTYTIQFPMIVAIFFLSCWADPAPLYMEFDSKQTTQVEYKTWNFSSSLKLHKFA